MTPSTLEFWGSQGRVGRVGAGEWSGKWVFAYPDTLPGWWTVVVDPSPLPGVPGDIYLHGTEDVLDKFDREWAIEWMSSGPDEIEAERIHFGWRPLLGPVDWLD